MEYIGVEGIGYWWLIPAFIFIFSLVGLALGKGLSGFGDLIIVSSLIAGSFLAFFSLTDLRSSLKVNEANTERIEAIEDVYGLNINDSDLLALKYPSEKPTTDTSIYGTYNKGEVTADGVLEQTPVTLAWHEGQLRLFEDTTTYSIGSEMPRINDESDEESAPKEGGRSIKINGEEVIMNEWNFWDGIR